MATQQNTFIRKFGKLAIIITVTDWNDFKELEKFSEHKDPDFLLSSFTDKNIYTNMNPSMLISTRGEVKDITDDTHGIGIDGILTGGSNAGPIWGYRKFSGLSALSEMITPKMEEEK
jgi:hypothetical protein